MIKTVPLCPIKMMNTFREDLVPSWFINGDRFHFLKGFKQVVFFFNLNNI